MKRDRCLDRKDLGYVVFKEGVQNATRSLLVNLVLPFRLLNAPLNFLSDKIILSFSS